jgi:hypothetical protein
MKYSRQDYLNNICSHREYYAQFVTEPIKAIVNHNLGNEIIASNDEHFNDIPLCKWDNLSSHVSTGDSLCAKVCILKECAKQIKEQQEKKKCLWCKKEFSTNWQYRDFCSQNCFDAYY